MTELPSASMQLPCRAPRPVSTSALPLNPMLMMICEPRVIVGGVGATAGWVPALTTTGSYTWTCPFGARIVASTNAPSVAPLTASSQPSPSWYGVARPLAESGLAGTASVQFIDAAASAAVWFGLMALPAASCALFGFARSPPPPREDWPPRKPPPKLPRPNAPLCPPSTPLNPVLAAWLIVVWFPPVTAMTIPRVSPNAIGMARGTAMRAARDFLLRRRRTAGRCPVSIQSTSMVAVNAPVDHVRPARTAETGILEYL